MSYRLCRIFFGRLLRLLIVLGPLSGSIAGQTASNALVPLFSQRNWTRADGLLRNEITGLCMDHTGYLWIATSAGLARFDGSRFLNCDTAPGGQLVDGSIAAIAADPLAEGLWVAPRAGGLLRFREGRFEAQPLPVNYSRQRVARLFVAGDRALWICFEGGEVMRLQGARPEIFGERDGLGAQRSTQIASDGAGRVWLANRSHLAWYEGGALHALPLDGINEDLRIASAHQDGPWVLTHGNLRKVVDGRLAVRIAVSSGFNSFSVQALLEDSTGAIWTGTRARGVRRLTLPEEKSDLAIESPEDVGVLIEDRAGNIWAGSNGGGLVRVRAGVVGRFDRSRGLLDSQTLGVCQDGAGTIWIANRDGGLAFINEQGRALCLLPPRMLDTFSVRSIVPAGPAGIWAATSHGLIYATTNGLLASDAAGAPPRPPDHGVMSVMHRTRNGDLWIALSPGRLGRLRDGVWRVFAVTDGPVLERVQSIAEDAQGRLWIGTAGGSLYRSDEERFTRIPLAVQVETGALQSIYIDDMDTCWIGTASAGLLHLGAASGLTLDEQHGLPTRNITQVIGDDQGSFWFGSPDGIFHVRRSELESFFAGRVSHVEAVLIGLDDGLPETTCLGGYQPSVWKARDGGLWFAARQGLIVVDPKREKVAPGPLTVTIDTLQVNGATREFNRRRVRLPAQARTVEFDYSVLCLSTPSRVRTEVRLVGYDDDWSVPDAPGRARYTRLPPGAYRLEVSAHVAGVSGTAATAVLPVIIEAAWWQTLWFRLGCASSVLLLGGLAVRVWSFRRLRGRLAKLEHDSVLEQERARIAQNIHDELGSGLSHISLLTQAAELGDPRVQLDKIYRTVSRLTQSMDEIVWAVNPKNDNLENFANYLVEFAQSFLTDAEIRCRVQLPETLPVRLVPAQFRHDLFLSCKEALNNVAKHACASEVTVELRVDAGRLVIVLSDNGVGLAATETAGVAVRSRAKNGLANMRARLAELGGSCEIASSPNGTTVTFITPLPATAPAA